MILFSKTPFTSGEVVRSILLNLCRVIYAKAKLEGSRNVTRKMRRKAYRVLQLARYEAQEGVLQARSTYGKSRKAKLARKKLAVLQKERWRQAAAPAPLASYVLLTGASYSTKGA